MFGRIPILLLTGLFVAVALTAHAVTPVVTTTAATGVTDSDAALNGTIDPLGDIFEVRAEYGLTAAYGYVTQGSSTFFGTGVQACSFHPSGLATNTTYHFRIIATTLDGASTYVGNDMTFTTLANPPTLGAVVAGVSNLQVGEASFSLNSLLSGSSQVTVTYEYGLTASYGSSVVSPTKVEKDLIAYTTCFAKATGLAPGTTYHFRAKAVNEQGTVYSADDTFTTPLWPVLVTTAATGVTDLAATMNGTVVTNGVVLNVLFEYDLTTDYGQELAAANGMNNTSAAPISVQPQGLQPATTYHYRVKAKYYWDQSLVYYGPDQTFTTGAAATPPTAGNVWGESVGTTTARVYCAPVFSGSSPTTAVFQYGLTTAYGSSVTALGEVSTNVSGATVWADLTGLTPDTMYHVRCVLTNGEGTVSSGDATVTTLLPPTVTTVAATSVGDLSAVLNGSVNPNGTSTTATLSFEWGVTTAYGNSLSATPGALVGAGSFTGNLTGLLPGTTYHYRARVYYPFGAGLYYDGPDVTFTTGAANTPPSLGSASSTRVTTSTAAVSVSNISAGSSDADIFWEYQAAGGSVQTVLGTPATRTLGSTGAAAVTLTQLLPGTAYTFRCGATNGQGTSYSASGSFTTLSAPTLTTAAATSVADVSAVLNGSANRNDGPGYILSYEIGQTTAYGGLAYGQGNYLTSASTAAFAAQADHLLPNTLYHYRLRAQEVFLVNGQPAGVLDTYYGADETFTTGPPATPPTATTQSASALAPTATTLNALFEAGSSPATVVFEYGETTAYGSQYSVPTAFAASAAATTTYVLQGLTPNTTYHYRVIVTNGEGSSTGGDVSFTTLSPPTVTTNAATGIQATTARLNGTSNWQNGVYTVTFDYGQTTAYGQTATPSTIVTAGGGGLTLGGIIIGGGGPIVIGGGNSPSDTSASAYPLLPLTAYHFRMKLTDGYGNSYYGEDASFTTVSPVQAWRMAKFSTIQDAGSAADMACPAGDGVPNLLKYALSMDPVKAAVPPQPQLKDYSGTQHLSLTFTRDPAKTDLTYEVQAADSPSGPWTTLVTSAGGAVSSGPGLVGETDSGFTSVELPGYGLFFLPVTVEVKDPVSMQDAPRRFMRLQVTRQQ